MKRRKLLTGISTAAVALALCMGITGTVQAAKTTDASAVQTEVTQVGAPAAPAFYLRQTKAVGQKTTGWYFDYSLAPGHQLWINVYDPAYPTKSETGEYKKESIDKLGREYFYTDNYRKYYNQNYSPYLLSASDFTPGKKSVVAYDFDSAGYEAAEATVDERYEAAVEAYEAAYDAYWDGASPTAPVYPEYEDFEPKMADYISPASAPVSIEVTMQAGLDAVIKSTSIQLSMTGEDKATGFEVYRKIGKKFKKVATVASDTYEDKGLLSKTEYSYKVRPYYKNPYTGVITYGKYTQKEFVTKGSALKLKLAVKGKKNVKLTWKKVSGAAKYEVYRRASGSASSVKAKGEYDGYGQWQLLKTLGKSKKSYVDKKTVANEDYEYLVRAVLSADKKVKGDKTITVEDAVSVSFAFDAPMMDTSYADAYGNVTVEWEKAYGIDGYAILASSPLLGKTQVSD